MRSIVYHHYGVLIHAKSVMICKKRAKKSLFLMICTQTSCVMIYHYSVMDKKSRIKIIRLFWWGEMDSNHRRWTPTDLQSVAIGRSATSPNIKLKMELAIGIEPTTCWLQVSCSACWATPAFCYGASGRNRTTDTGIFSPLLYRLSYRGIKKWRPGTGSNRRPPAWQAGVLTNWTTGPWPFLIFYS